MTDEHLAHSIRHGPKHILSKSENIFSCILLEHIERGGGGTTFDELRDDNMLNQQYFDIYN